MFCSLILEKLSTEIMRNLEKGDIAKYKKWNVNFTWKKQEISFNVVIYLFLHHISDLKF